MPFLTVYLEVQRKSAALIEFAYPVTVLITLVSSLVLGRLIDTIGPKRVLLVGYGSSLVPAIVLGWLLQHDNVVGSALFLHLFSASSGSSHSQPVHNSGGPGSMEPSGRLFRCSPSAGLNSRELIFARDQSGLHLPLSKKITRISLGLVNRSFDE